MNETAIHEIAKAILSTLETEKFSRWFNEDRFKAYIEGGEMMKEKIGTESAIIAETLILQDIKRLFNL